MKRKVKNKLNRALKLSLYMLFIIIAVFFITKFILIKTVVTGSSMAPSLKDGEVLLTECVSYRFREPERFDIAVFPNRYNSHELIVKRIIGLPGESVSISDGRIFINGTELADKYGSGYTQCTADMKSARVLAKNEYFVLGDNREDSIDSRYDEVGAVRREFITGKVFFRLKPFDRAGKVR